MKALRSELLLFCSFSALLLAGCGGGDGKEEKTNSISIDGSSTVLPISSRMVEAFEEINPNVRIAVKSSGTSGGFKRFVVGELEIADASRPINEKEKAECAKNGIEFVELTVALDGITVCVHSENDWAKCMSVEMLNKLWGPDSKITKWSELNPDWPDEEVNLYGAGSDSGTYEFFNEAINGNKAATREKYTASENDQIAVTGITNNKGSLGYFGYSYYEANKDKMQALPIIAKGKGEDCADAVEPSKETIQSGTYLPLSRPLYIYVSKKALERKEVQQFVDFYLNAGIENVEKSGYFLPTDEVLKESRDRLSKAIGGK